MLLSYYILYAFTYICYSNIIMQAVSISQLRSNLKRYLDAVTEADDTLIVSRSAGEEAVVVISLKEYNSLVETGHLLSTEANRNRLRQSITQINEGKLTTYNS